MERGFFANNRKKLVQGIEEGSMIILFAGRAPKRSADENYDFTPNRNFYYLTGIEREKVVLLISKNKGNVKEILFIEEPDSFREKWTGKMMKKEEATGFSGIEDVQYLDSFFTALKANITSGCISVYMDIEHDDWDMPLNPAQLFADEIRGKFPYVSIKNIYKNICALRVIKSDEEVSNIRKAIEITNEGIKNMMKNARPGMMEYELEAYFDFTLKSNGVRQPAFNTIAASGVNGAVLHYRQNDSKAGDNDLILFDLGASYNYYAADISRTFPLTGKFTQRQKDIYNVVLEALYETIKIMKPGVHFKDLNETAKKILTDGCKKLGLIKDDNEISKYYYHGVSHFLGLDTHDVGTRDCELEKGMVLTVEPGLYIEEEKTGVRIEDNVLITDDGCEILSKDIIRTADEIELFMKK